MFTSLDTSARGPSRFAAFLLPGLLAALLAGCGGGDDRPTPTPPAQPDHPAGSAGATYDVIPLGIPGAFGNITRQGIANGGIVAGTTYGGPGGLGRAFLYDGKTEVDLGTLGGAFAQALALNPCGHVTGSSARADGAVHAFLYTDTMHDLGTVGGAESSGNGITNCGKITGWAVTSSGQGHAFLYDGKTMLDLGTFGGTRSEGRAINKAGQIVGEAFGPGDAWFHPFLYDSRTGAPMRDLGTLGASSGAVDINDAGQVVGVWRGAGELPRTGGFYYEAGVMRDMGTLGGNSTVVNDLNEAGIAVGVSSLADGSEQGFVYDGKTMTAIGVPPGYRFSEAVAINAKGLVVGAAAQVNSAGEHAISWTAKEGIVDLNERVHEPPPGLVLIRALAVADDGNIAVRTNRGLALLKLRH